MKKEKVIPMFINLRANADSISRMEGVRQGKLAWLKKEISEKHALLRTIEVDLYYVL